MSFSTVGPVDYTAGGVGGRSVSFSIAPATGQSLVYRSAGAMTAGVTGTLAPAIPAGATTDDILIVFSVARFSNGTLAAPAGWTQIFNNSAIESLGIAAWWKVHSGSESAPSVTNSVSTGGWGVKMIALQGAHTTVPIFDNKAITAFGSGPFPSAPAVAVKTGGLALFYAAHNDDATLPSPTSGTVLFSEGSIEGNDFGHVLVSMT